MRKKLVAGNWKMHGSLSANEQLLDAVKAASARWAGVDSAVCVPFPYLAQARDALRGSSIEWGAQTLNEHDAGAHTGEVAGAMLRDFECRYVIVGHSERRQLYGETDAQVAAKFVAAQRAGLTPILCVGETLDEREQDATEQVVARQLDAVMDVVGAAALGQAVLAYEPVWAIGTGRTATPEQAQAVHRHVRERIRMRDAAVAEGVRILYGGSVKPANAAELFAMPDVDGGLIGGASLVADDFIAICVAAKTE